VENADITDYHDTAGFRWRRRVKGGGVREQRSNDEPPVGGQPTLCDRLEGWTIECRGSDDDHCEAHVKSNQSCTEWCEGQGLWCQAAWDNRRDGCERVEPRRPVRTGSCDAVRSDQICRCRPECRDEGPWPCTEAGCPGRMVNCSTLAVACKAGFGDVWDKPPAGTANLAVASACPLSCGQCACPAPSPPPRSLAWPFA